MTKRLYLLRHAQAAPSGTGISDIDRFLTDKGLGDAAALGKYLSSQNLKPELVLCSSAKRTQQTLKELSTSFDELNVQKSVDIYHASAGQLLGMIQDCTSTQSIMIVGHNPSIYELAAMLSTQGCERVLSRLSQGYQPASLSIIDCECESWAEINPDHCALSELVNPLDYNAPERPTRWM